MAIMAMATAKIISDLRIANVIAILSYFVISSSATAGEWQFTPAFGIEETYTDNVELTITDPTSSLVSQAIIGLETEYESRLANFSFSAENNNLFYSHDSDINDSYLTLETQGRYLLWTSGPEIFAIANVDNTNRNAASNGLANLVSGDTVQSEQYSTGFRYNVSNSSFSVTSSLVYVEKKYDDGIGEYNGSSAIINTNSGSSARTIFWNVSSAFSTREQDFSGETRSGDQYTIDASLGLILSSDWSPFVRFYNEDFSGNSINQNQQTTSSWGPGFRWLISPHLMLNLSYNYVDDDTVSDDYISTLIQWEPSARTSLNASYSKRFFGDSYSLDFKHKTKRLTNAVTYNETLEVFDRNNYEQINVGIFWCPSNIAIESISNCFAQSEQPTEGDFQLASFSYLEPVESNEFSLNKSFAWSTKLELSRTSFALSTSASRREGIESNIIDDKLNASFTIDRKISAKSNLTFLAKYDYFIFDKDNPSGSRQEDHYRTVSATYTKDLASSLSAHFTVENVNRDSNLEQYTYKEVRAIINVTKDF